MQTTFPISSSIHASAHCDSCGYKPTGIVTGPDGNVWVSEQNNPYIERLTPSGTYTSFYTDAPMPINNVYSDCTNQSWALANGPDGNLWFTKDCFLDPSSGQPLYSQIGMITPAGVVTRFTLPNVVAANNPPPYLGAQPFGMTAGPDGNMWFTEQGYNNIGRITTSGTITLFPVPTANSGLKNIASAPDGNLWFAESNASQIGRITPAGVVTEFPLSANAQPTGIATGPDGDIWFTEFGVGKVGRMSTAGSGYVEFALPTANSQPTSITSAPDGAMWVAEFGARAVGRITTTGAVSEYPTQNAPFGITPGPQGIWYTAFDVLPGAQDIWQNTVTDNDVVGRLPQVTCADLTSSMTTPAQYRGPRAAPGDQVTFNATVTNCGTPALTNVTTTTSVTPPAGCPQSAAVPSSTATLAYGQSSTQHYAFAAPSCVGDYVLTSHASASGSVITSTTTDYVVSSGGGSRIAGDFNGDGISDVAQLHRGDFAVAVFYGTAAGITVAGQQSFGLDVLGPSGAYSLTEGDFNHDGYADLAIGGDSICPYGPDPTTHVVVLYGGPVGLTTNGVQSFLPPSSLTLSSSMACTSWGESVTAGDFNADGYDDLAVGSPDDGEATDHGGSVALLFGSASGLAPPQTIVTKATPGMPGPQPAADQFGQAIKAGDFNHDGFADLAISAGAGSAVYALYGSPSGITTTSSQFMPGIAGGSGHALAVGDFNGDGFKDLAVATPGISPNAYVEIHYGSVTGLGKTAFKTAQRFWPTRTGMPAGPYPDQWFANALTAGDFNHDGRDDLVISARWASTDPNAPYYDRSGGAYILKGGANGITTKGAKIITTGDDDGFVLEFLGTSDFNADGYADLLLTHATGPAFEYNGSLKGLRTTPATSFTAGGGFWSAPGSTYGLCC